MFAIQGLRVITGLLAPTLLVLLDAVAVAAVQDPAACDDQAPGKTSGETPRTASDASDKLPWEKKASPHPAPQFRPISGPREFLARYGIGDSQWEGFFGGQPLSPAEEEVLVRLLDLYPRFGQENVEAWAERNISWDQLAAQPEYRAKIVRLTGRVQRVTKVALLPEVAARHDFDHYYEVRLQINNAPYLAVIYCLEFPAAWKLDTELDLAASAYGLFLKVGDPSEEPPTLLFATRRVAWHPDRPDPDLKIDGAHVALAKLGVDLGRFQEVGREREAGLLAADREPFYQILSAVTDPRAGELLRRQAAELDVVALLQEPQKFQGHVLPVRGVARRVARIDVPDADIRQRFGIDHYFELDLSVPLEKTIRLGADPKKKLDAVVYENSFPATICVRELPAGLPVGDDVRQMVQADGVFFKIWLYQSSYAAQANLAQPAPLFLARRVEVIDESSPSRWLADLVVGVAMTLAVLTFVGIVLWFRWSDRTGRGRVPLAGVDQPKPDFTNLG